MTLEQKNEKSGGVSEKTGSFMVWLRREKRRWLAGSMQRGKKMALLLPLSGEEQTLFWLLLWPLVISEILWKFHFRASKWKTVYSRRSTRTEDIFLSKDFSSSSVFLSRYMTWPTAICDKQWIQYSTKDENRKNVPWQGKKSPVWKSQSFFFFVICWTVWEVSDSVSFSPYRHRWVLFWSRLWPFLCQLCRQFPVPVS